MPKPIRRLGPIGPVEIHSEPAIELTEDEVHRACVALGDMYPAQTTNMYFEGLLDPSDRKLIHEVVSEQKQELKEQELKERDVQSLDGRLFSDSIAPHINPRDPEQTWHKQKFVKRDSETGRILGVTDELL